MKKCISIISIAFLCCASLSLISQTVNLNEAVVKDDTARAAQILQTGANPNQVDPYGNSPLMVACRWGSIGMVKLLLDNKATADEPRSAKGRTPLMIGCAYYSGITIVKMLVANGAAVNATASDGTTPLILAAKNCKLDVIEYLLEKGADASHKDANGQTALDYASKAQLDDLKAMGIKDCRIDKEAVIARLTGAGK